MANTSATGGYLAPAITPAPLQGQSLEDFLQQVLSFVSGLPGKSVIPRWQQEPPNLANIGTNWAALGIQTTDPDWNAVQTHDPDGTTKLSRNEQVEILTSFYGPQAELYAGVFRDGIQVDQNREVLQLAEMGLVSTGRATAVPSLVKERWLYRVDLPWVINRLVRRTYPVLNLLIAQGTLDNELYTTQLITP